MCGVVVWVGKCEVGWRILDGGRVEGGLERGGRREGGEGGRGGGGEGLRKKEDRLGLKT